MSDDKTKGHTALPINYVAGDHEHMGALWCKTHCIADVDLSPEWAERLTRAVNCHEDLVKALKDARARLMHHGYVPAGKHGRGDPEITEIDAVLKRAKEQTP